MPIRRGGIVKSERRPTLGQPVVAHVWVANLQEICWARLARLRSRVRPVDAVIDGPLALMGSAARGLFTLAGCLIYPCRTSRLFNYPLSFVRRLT